MHSLDSRYLNKKIGMLGFARTGRQTCEFLLQNGAKIFVWDDDPNKLNQLKNEDNKLAKFLVSQAEAQNLFFNAEEEKIKELDFLVVSPGIPLYFPKPHRIVEIALSNSIPLSSDLELLQELAPEPTYIGITGTNGKSTTTSLIGHILKHANKDVEVGGNIGISVLGLRNLSKEGYYVLEVSSFQLDLLNKFKFNISLLLNITPDHLDRHGSMERYIEAKEKIFANQDASSYAVISVDDPICRNIYEKISKQNSRKVIPISVKEQIKNGISLIEGVIHDNFNHRTLRLAENKKLPGEHNAQNILASYAVCSACKVEPEQALEAISTFQGLPHRMEIFLEKGNLRFINDSKATNSDAAEKALKSFDNIYWILGGICKDEGIEPLSAHFFKIKFAFCIGKAADQFAEVLQKYKVPHKNVGTIENALNEINSIGISAGNVLLSPSCASFDQWKDYEHRGNVFKELALKMFR